VLTIAATAPMTWMTCRMTIDNPGKPAQPVKA
jgi:hypothetical protein